MPSGSARTCSLEVGWDASFRWQAVLFLDLKQRKKKGAPCKSAGMRVSGGQLCFFGTRNNGKRKGLPLVTAKNTQVPYMRGWSLQFFQDFQRPRLACRGTHKTSQRTRVWLKTTMTSACQVLPSPTPHCMGAQSCKQAIFTSLALNLHAGKMPALTQVVLTQRLLGFF